MKCPVCSDSNLVLSERQGVEIDYCPKCRGVWLDRGELDKIIEGSNTVIDNVQTSRFDEKKYSENKYDDDYYKRKKRKSFLDDIFDF